LDLSKNSLLDLYRTMSTIRKFENRATEELVENKLVGLLHSSAGQEAVAAGVCANLSNDDYLTSTHRGHGHSIAKGVAIRSMMAEIFGRSGGANRGKGGSMHVADFAVGMIGANGIVGSSIPLACGAALKAKITGSDQVAVSFFGDGAANQGVLHESMNLASIWKLPVIFVCENNLYAQATPSDYAMSVKDVAVRAQGYDIPSTIVDGMDIIEVYKAANIAINRARSGGGPTFIEAKTYRYEGHFAGDNPLRYRLTSEENQWRERDPISNFKTKIREENQVTDYEIDNIDIDIDKSLDEAVDFAKRSPQPDKLDLFSDVYSSYPMNQLDVGGIHDE
jgi:TPP-dependent pyruvate/acetoin dehydrogenase alpha subunit